ncbi:MAG: prepilin-type N-terminal cleavage/methylation domain-containing protein [Cyanobacteria bacterium P01_D01_bin.44]
MIKRIVRRLLIEKKRSVPSGFTLIEILVSLIVASIVVTGLLYLVVELLQIDRREAFLDETQRNMQRAIDYIADDLRESIYVYSTPTTITSNLTGNYGFPADGVPVLAFWKPQPLDTDVSGGTTVYDQLPADCSALSGDDEANCNALKIRQAYYTLVVYYTTDTPSAVWEGKGRLLRYSLPEYLSSDITATSVAPVNAYRENSPAADFEGWTPSATGPFYTPPETVLVDYLADWEQNPTPPTTLPACDAGYQASPETPGDRESFFFACIRPIDTANEALNQDVVLYLKGDARGESERIINSFSDRSELPAIQTQVLVRGVLDKDTEN